MVVLFHDKQQQDEALKMSRHYKRTYAKVNSCKSSRQKINIKIKKKKSQKET